MDQPTRILVVDDDPDVLAGTARVLAKAGYNTAQAVSGEDALQSLPAFRPDLVLLDRDLPGLDGVEVCRRIKEEHSAAAVFVVLISGTYTDSDQQAEGLEAGADGYIARPIGNRELVARTDAYVRILQLTRSLDAERQRLEEKNAALQESEERFHAIFEQATDNIILLHVEDHGPPTIVDINRAGLQIHGYKRSEVVGKPISILDTPESAAEIPERMRNVLEGGAAEFQVSHASQDGRKLSLDVRAKLIELGGKPHVLTVERDVTKRLEMEVQLRESQKMAAIGTLAGGIAHDFNNILGVILGFSELVLLGVQEGSDVTEDIAEIVRAGERARDLVKQILAFSRKSGQARQPIRAHEVIGDALRLLRQTIPANIPIEQAIETDSDTILANPTQIHQVLTNLCTNAYHAVRGAGGTLSVTLEPVAVTQGLAVLVSGLKAGPHLRLTVADTGVGMDSDTLNRALEPFFTTKPQGEGTGMGLAVVHGIVRSHGGALRIESRLGGGTRIEVYLPRHHGDADQDPSTPQAVTGGTERILVVDDEPTLARVTAKILSSIGYSVELVTTSGKALEMFLEDPQRFDLVLTDQAMPGMTGATLAKRMLAVRPDLPIVICTGFSESIDAEKAREIGVKGFLQKPMERALLAKTLRDALDGKCSGREAGVLP